jgi:hypothetical protein
MTWVHDGIFAAGGKHIPETWSEFADQTGVTAVLHLAPDRPTCFLGPPPEAFLWMDIADEMQADLDDRFLAAHFINDCLKAGHRVMIHSSLGRHRTRWVYVAFCILSGRSLRATLRRAAERPWLSPYHTDTGTWQAFGEIVSSSQGILVPPDG